MSKVEKKIAIIEDLAHGAWVRLAAARDVVLLSESNGEDVFTWDEKDGLEQLARQVEELIDRMVSRRPAADSVGDDKST